MERLKKHKTRVPIAKLLENRCLGDGFNGQLMNPFHLLQVAKLAELWPTSVYYEYSPHISFPYPSWCVPVFECHFSLKISLPVCYYMLHKQSEPWKSNQEIYLCLSKITPLSICLSLRMHQQTKLKLISLCSRLPNIISNQEENYSALCD